LELDPTVVALDSGRTGGLRHLGVGDRVQ
jgi:hypothetical protein